MSPLELVLYIGLGLITAIIVGRTIYKFVKNKKSKDKDILDLIKQKKVQTDWFELLKDHPKWTVAEYNWGLPDNMQLTDEEFEKLKKHYETGTDAEDM